MCAQSECAGLGAGVETAQDDTRHLSLQQVTRQRLACTNTKMSEREFFAHIVMIMQGLGAYTSQKPTAWYRRQEVLGLTPGSVSLPTRQVSLRWIPRGLWNVTIKIVDRASMCTAASVPLQDSNMDGAGNRNLKQFKVGQAVKTGKGL